MLSFFKRWFSPEERFDTYTPEEKLIYKFYNGERWVHADPLVLWKKVMAVGPDLDIDYKVSQSISKDAEKAHAALVKRIRGIFQLLELTNNIEVVGTLTDTQCIKLLNHFLAYCGWVKKNSKQTPTSAQETLPSTASSSTESQATSPMQDSGSTGNGASTGTPTASPTESVSDSEPTQASPTSVT